MTELQSIVRRLDRPRRHRRQTWAATAFLVLMNLAAIKHDRDKLKGHS